MTYYLLLFLTVFLISVGLFLLKKTFFSFAQATVSLLDIMLDSSMNELAKQKRLIQKLGKLLSTFGLLFIFFMLVIGLALTPMMLYIQLESISVGKLDMSSAPFYVSMILGSFVLFVFPLRKKKDYSDWSILLHKIAFDNYNISKSLFGLEKKLFKKKVKRHNETFVIVSGLARAGTSVLTNLLFQTKHFHSLSYANMPFLLAVNIWKKLYTPSKNKLKQRAHGDRVMFGYKTIEALEEYFFKVFLNNKFITDSTLTEHEFDKTIYKDYLIYQNLINFNGADSTYLAKNNNLILRYESFRKHNAHFKIILAFRYPMDQAVSLMNQHKRFSELQEKDPFILDYMNWLGHHEFGLNHKAFDLGQMDLSNPYNTNSINYWLTLWISYYTRILSLLGDKNLILVEYADLYKEPRKLLSAFGGALKLDLALDEIEPFKKTIIQIVDVDPELKKKSITLYNELVKHKIEISY